MGQWHMWLSPHLFLFYGFVFLKYSIIPYFESLLLACKLKICIGLFCECYQYSMILFSYQETQRFLFLIHWQWVRSCWIYLFPNESILYSCMFIPSSQKCSLLCNWNHDIHFSGKTSIVGHCWCPTTDSSSDTAASHHFRKWMAFLFFFSEE